MSRPIPSALIRSRTMSWAREDGVAKTPEWASKKCGVPEWTIKALARDWAKKTVSIAHYFGGSYVRGPYSHEPARLECVLLAMQGLGGPGVWQTQITYGGMPRAEGIKTTRFFNPVLGERLIKPTRSTVAAWGKQLIPKTLVHKAIQAGLDLLLRAAALSKPALKTSSSNIPILSPKKTAAPKSI